MYYAGHFLDYRFGCISVELKENLFKRILFILKVEVLQIYFECRNEGF